MTPRERRLVEIVREAAAKVCGEPEPECCGNVVQYGFDSPPECCGKWEPRPKDADECATAIRALDLDELVKGVSEQVSDELDPSVNVPWMRCSPGLPGYIAALRFCDSDEPMPPSTWCAEVSGDVAQWISYYQAWQRWARNVLRADGSVFHKAACAFIKDSDCFCDCGALPSSTPSADSEAVTAALRELVRLKGLKERIESDTCPLYEKDEMLANYEQRKEPAWAAARLALSASKEQERDDRVYWPCAKHASLPWTGMALATTPLPTVCPHCEMEAKQPGPSAKEGGA